MGHQIRYLISGAVIGAFLGALHTNIAICVLARFGWPDFYIRPGCEVVDLAFHTCGGGIVGLFFGGCLIVFAKATGRRIPILRLALGTILVAMPVYGVYIYFSVRHRKLVAPLLPDAFVFVCGLAIAWHLAKRTGPPPPTPRP